MKLLIVEDSVRLRRALKEGLGRSGFTVDAAADGLEGLAFAETNDYDVIILDLMLPKLDGLSVLTRLRSQRNCAQVLILSAKDQVQDRVRGLELGGDDYLIKPFAFEELVARIKSLSRRRYDAKNPVLDIGLVKIDTVKHRVTGNGQTLDLTPGEYKVLEYLGIRQGRVISKHQLREQIHDSGNNAISNVVEVLVSSLRKKLRAAGVESVIKTKRGFGYYID